MYLNAHQRASIHRRTCICLNVRLYQRASIPTCMPRSVCISSCRCIYQTIWHDRYNNLVTPLQKTHTRARDRSITSSLPINKIIFQENSYLTARHATTRALPSFSWVWRSSFNVYPTTYPSARNRLLTKQKKKCTQNSWRCIYDTHTSLGRFSPLDTSTTLENSAGAQTRPALDTSRRELSEDAQIAFGIGHPLGCRAIELGKNRPRAWYIRYLGRPQSQKVTFGNSC